MSWVATAIGGSALLGTGTAFALSGGKKGQTISADQLIPTFQRQTGEKLASWIKQYMDQYVPGEIYPSGKLSAGMTGAEGTGLSILDKFLGGTNIGDLFRQSKGQISDTLSGKFANPNTSPFISAMKDISSQDLADAINASRRGTGARGKFFSTASLGEEKDLTNRNLQSLNSVIGNFIQNERQNMFNAVPVANAMDQYELSTVPLAKVQASQTFGALNRILEQADLERQYNDYLRKREEMKQPVISAQGLYGTQQPYGIQNWQIPTQQRSTGQNIASVLQQIPWSSLISGIGAWGGGGTIVGGVGGTNTGMQPVGPGGSMAPTWSPYGG